MSLCTCPFHALLSKAMEGYGARVPLVLLLSLSVVAIGLKRVEETQSFQSNVVARQGGSACPRTRPPRCGDELKASGKNLLPLLADDTKPGFLPHAFSRFDGAVEACPTPATRPVPGRGDILIDNSPQNRCNSQNLLDKIANMSSSQPLAKRGGRLFIDCGAGTTTIFLKETIILAQGASRSNPARYALVAVRGCILLSGGDCIRILRQERNTDVRIFGLEFIKGRATSMGGGAILNAVGDCLYANGCNFVENVADSAYNKAVEGGGAVKSILGSAIFVDCEFKNNMGNTGGAISHTSSNLELYKCKFIRNASTGSIDGSIKSAGPQYNAEGGAVRVDRVRKQNPRTVKIIDCVFTNNKAKPRRGKLLLGSTVTIFTQDKDLAKNEKLLEMQDTKFIRNRQLGATSVLAVHGIGRANISKSVFSQNLSSKWVVFVNLMRKRTRKKTGDYITFTDVSFNSNKGRPIRPFDTPVILKKATSNEKPLRLEALKSLVSPGSLQK